MDVATTLASCAFQATSAPYNTFADIVMISSSSSESESDQDTLDQENQDNFGVDAMPRDRESLEHELARLDELERRIQSHTAVDLVLGWKLLSATHQEQVAKAHSALERRHAAARKVCEYAAVKARETYTSRCNELQREMSTDFERELRRLQTAKDGVSVTSRRRRSVRDDGGFSTPAKNSGNGMRRRRTMYNSDGEDGPEDVFLASASPEERAHRVQFQEKKRLERLLGRASVFKPAVKLVTPQEIAEDLEAIRSAVPCRREHLETTENKSGKKNKKIKQHLPKKKQQKPKRQRPMIITPRRIPHASGPNLPASATSRHRMTKTTKKRRPRMHYNPRMLQEGQEVEVFKRQRPPAGNGEDERQDECVMSGIITAATATQVYLLTASGRFESFDVRDCVLGSLYVRAAGDNNSPTKSARHPA
ncbi:Hypothetical protein PHPALM_1491 [Phytophthora palmivora]|uniref:Uncharacterized protein n=1 Tax=Phytophthora palmivora TaxID=4796 RepID=A0A2P4YS74_9STRA|nr:Hypothetical protein PHPALM_1491 [Phytophthora palmivora]